ncbi:MAG: LLM class flavin-dependent oxidoreductase [Chloroflexota bacterium]
MSTTLKFGLLLPHFGREASIEKCLEGARRAEAYGFDSVWARDHVVFQPHDLEGNNNAHIESLLLLSAVASMTQRITLGTAMTICHRHPIYLAQSFSSLSVLSGGRVILGMGLGGFAHEFAAVGRPTDIQERAALARLNVDICRRLWSGEKLSYSGGGFSFEGVVLKPTPIKPIPIWVGGGTTAACRRAVAYGDGWMPARVTLATFSERIKYLRELCREAARPMIETAVMPLTTIGKDRRNSLQGIDLKTIMDESQRFTKWVEPGGAENRDGSRGIVLAGSPADIVDESRAYEAAGANHIVYDLRLRYADWYDQIELLGEEVLPALRGS